MRRRRQTTKKNMMNNIIRVKRRKGFRATKRVCSIPQHWNLPFLLPYCLWVRRRVIRDSPSFLLPEGAVGR